jgi:hypothetical protein
MIRSFLIMNFVIVFTLRAVLGWERPRHAAHISEERAHGAKACLIDQPAAFAGCWLIVRNEA